MTRVENTKIMLFRHPLLIHMTNGVKMPYIDKICNHHNKYELKPLYTTNLGNIDCMKEKLITPNK